MARTVSRGAWALVLALGLVGCAGGGAGATAPTGAGGAGSGSGGAGGGSGGAIALEVPLTLEERAGVTRVAEPVTSGLPLAPGAVRDTATLWIADPRGRAVPAQFRVEGRWPDGSIRWLLCDFQADVPAGGTVRYRLRAGGGANPAPAQPVQVRTLQTGLEIETGAARFRLASAPFRLFDGVWIGQQRLVAPDPASGIVVTGAGSPAVVYRGERVRRMSVLDRGPLRVRVRVEGEHVASSGATLCRYTLDLVFHAGRSDVVARYRIENPNKAIHPGNVWDLGSPGSRWFEDVGLVLALPLAAGARRYAVRGETLVQGALGSDRVGIYQDSSGGAHWNSDNHLNWRNKLGVSFRGHRIFEGSRTLATGNRAQGALAVWDDRGGCAVSIDRFWQTFPNALDYAGGRLAIRPFPGDSAYPHELQGGEYATKRMLWHFFGAGGQARWEQAVRAWHAPLFARAPAAHYAAAQPLWSLPVPDGRHPRWESWRRLWVEPARPNPRTALSQREPIDEYGWRNFGDLMADHETRCGRQSWDVPISHYNNQYDGVAGQLLEWMRSGDARLLAMGIEGARHMADIDVYHADDPPYSGGHFWHTAHDLDAYLSTHRTFSAAMQGLGCASWISGGPGLGHLYIEGLVTYAHLCGDDLALGAAREVAEFALDFYARTGGAHSFREAGNALRTLVTAHREFGDARYLAVAADLVQSWQFPPRTPRWNFGLGMYGLALHRYIRHMESLGKGNELPVQRARGSLVAIADFLASATATPDVSATYLSDTLVVAALHHPSHANRQTWLRKAETIWRAIFDRQPTWSALKPQSFMGTGGLLWPYYEQGGR